MAQLSIVIGAQDNATKVLQGVGKAADATLGGLGRAAGVAATALAGVGVVAGGALAAGLGASVKAAADFESQMSGIKAVSGATGAEMEAMSKLALKLGADTSFSASSAAAGIEELVKGGLTIADIMGGAAEATLNLAAAGGVELADAATIAANALAQFGLKGSDMEHVSNLIAGAANASAISVQDFKFSLQAAGAVAATVGFSFDDLAQGIAIMGKAGIAGSDAGTSLKTMMMNLQPTTKAQTKLFAELGLITEEGGNAFFDASGKVKSMADVAGLLQRSLAGMTEQQKVATLEVMFGSDAIRAGAVLAKEGAAGFSDMAGAMGKVTAASVGAERLNNLSGSMEQLKGSLETAGITLGMSFLPVLRQLVDAATAAVNGALPLIEVWGPKLAEAVGGGLAQVMPLLDRLAPTVAAVADSVMSGFGLVRDTIQQALTGDVSGAISTFLGGMVDARLSLVETLAGWGVAFVEWVAPMVPPLLAELGRLGARVVTWLVGHMPAIVAQLQEWGERLWAWVAPMIPPLLTELGILGGRLLAWVGEQAPPLLQRFATEWVPAALDWVLQAGIDIVPKLGAFAEGLMAWVTEHGPEIAKVFVRDWIPAALMWLAQLAIDIIPKLFDLLVTIGGWVLTTGVPTMVRMFAALGKGVLDGIIEGAQANVDRLLNLMGQIAERALNAAKEKLGIRSPSHEFAEEVGRPIIEGIIAGIKGEASDLLSTMDKTLMPALDNGVTAFGDMGDLLVGELVPVMDDITIGVLPRLGEGFDDLRIDVNKATAAVQRLKEELKGMRSARAGVGGGGGGDSIGGGDRKPQFLPETGYGGTTVNANVVINAPDSRSAGAAVGPSLAGLARRHVVSGAL